MGFILPDPTATGNTGSGTEADPATIEVNKNEMGLYPLQIAFQIENPDPVNYDFNSASLTVYSSDMTPITNLGQPSWRPGYEGSILDQTYLCSDIPLDTTATSLYVFGMDEYRVKKSDIELEVIDHYYFWLRVKGLL